MKKHAVLYSVLILTALVITSCATIIHGSKQSVNISSHPSGAQITIDGVRHGLTPQVIDLRRKGRMQGESMSKTQYNVKVEMEGYVPYEVVIKRTLDGWIFGNVIFGGLIGVVIDAGTGSMYRLTPDQVIAHMGQKSLANDVKKDDEKIYLDVTLNVDTTWEKIGTIDRIK